VSEGPAFGLLDEDDRLIRVQPVRVEINDLTAVDILT
jgi:hypothetical protein